MVLMSFLIFLLPVFGLEIIVLYGLLTINNRVCVPSKKWVFPFAWLFAIFGYSVIPISETDLTRYYDMIDKCGNKTLLEIILSDKDRLYTKDILFYFVSKVGNHQFLPFVVGFVIYAIVFYILIDMVQRSSHDFSKWEIIMMGLTSTGVISAYSVIGNVRCVLAYVLISFAVYRDMMQKKRNIWTLLLYIVPIGLHISAVIVLGLRIAQLLTKYIGKFIIIIAVILPVMIDLGFKYLNILGNGNIIFSLLQNAIGKAYYYLHWTEGGWADEVTNSLSDKVNRTYGTFFIVMMIVMLFIADYSGKQARDDEQRVMTRPMVNYLVLASVCALGCLSIKTGAFWRFEAIVVLFSPVILVPLFENKSNILKFLLKILFISVCIILCINMVWLSRNIIVGDTIYNFMTSCGLKIIYELLKGIWGCLF